MSARKLYIPGPNQHTSGIVYLLAASNDLCFFSPKSVPIDPLVIDQVVKGFKRGETQHITTHGVH